MLPALRVGRRYAARVVELWADGRVRLALSDHQLVARAEAPVRLGETVEVEVIRLVPEVVLRVRRPDPAKVAGSGAGPAGGARR
jgi:hypothetical protein